MNDTEPAVDVDLLAERVADLTATVTGLANDLDRLAQNIVPALYPEPRKVTGQEYESLEAWVEVYLLPTFRRQFGGEYRWCQQWTDHPEAVTRLGALWQTWETLHAEPDHGMATWLGQYLDPQLAALLHRGGTFATCTPTRHMPSP